MLGRAARLDFAALRWLRTAGHSPGAERAVREYSRLGEHAAVWLAIGAAGTAVDAPRRARWRRATLTVGAAYLANTAVKLVVRRARPQLDDLPPLVDTPTQLSLPSAHATSGFAGARAYSALVPGAPLYGLAASLALTRVYLGVHYPSDVVAGALLGTLLGSAGR